jgi:membrane protease YdiL (CAAX protease family)
VTGDAGAREPLWQRPWPRFFLLLGLGVVATMLLAGPAFDVARAAGWLDDDEYLRSFRRLLTVALIVAVLVGFRPWRDGDLASYGLRGSRAGWAPAAKAFAVAALLAAALLALDGALGLWSWRRDVDGWALALRVARFLPGAAVAALVEEWLFRGWMVRRLARRLPLGAAAAVAAVLFGALHAFRPAFHARAAARDPWRGLQAVGDGFVRLVDPGQFGPFFLGLTLFALVLTAAWLRTGTLWTAVGAHAGAVWVLYGFSPLLRWAPGPAWLGSKAVADGVPSGLALAALAVVLWPRRSSAGG